MILNETRRKNLDYLKVLEKYKTKCKCGHVVIILYRPFTICRWCGRKVYRSKKDEFLDKVGKLK